MQRSRQMEYENGKQMSLLLLLLLMACSARAFLIPIGKQQLYALESHVSLEHLNGSLADEVSYTFTTRLKVDSVWNNDEDQLLEVQITNSRISAPGKGRSDQKKRFISSLSYRPFYVSLIKGQPHQVIAHTARDQSVLNLERGIASLLQLSAPDTEEESSISGHCRVRYKMKTPTRVEKTKKDCALWDLRVNYHPDDAFGVVQRSEGLVVYDLATDGTLMRAESTELHRLSLAAKPNAGSMVRDNLCLQHVGQGKPEVKQFEFPTLEAVVENLLDWYRAFQVEADADGVIGQLKDQTFKKQFEKRLSEFQLEAVGNASLALVYVQLLPLARIAKQAQFEELLEAHPKLAPQLMDLFGAVQTFAAHNATFTHYFKSADTTVESMELLEKYLQSLAVATHPERKIVEHLFNWLKHKDNYSLRMINLRDSVLQTLATLTRQSGFESNEMLQQQIREFILEELSIAQESILYIRALQNLRDPLTIDELLKQATQPSQQSTLEVAALQALKAFPAQSFGQPHRQQFESIFYQRQRRYDSSARTLALDLLLAMRPSADHLGELLDYLASNDRNFEIKTYVLQKLRMLADICPRFRTMFEWSLQQRAHVNNYNVLAQRGLSTVLTRQLSQSPFFNETLVSTQEVYQGILKRGSVEFLLHAGLEQARSFKLGIYTAGLGSVVGDDDVSDGDGKIPPDSKFQTEETMTAGMEISVQSTQLRPLVFFNGQTELMGHIWGGTASESTPAYQATTLTQDHEQYIVLASGATLHWRVLGARSVDLNGKVGFSLWNRNAQTEIQQNTGSAVHSLINVGFTNAKLLHKLTLTNEPKLSLQADLDFYSGIKLCMQLQRPEQLFTHTYTRSVYLLGVEKAYAKHMRFLSTHKSPGCTFVLNQKNNEMCNKIIPY